MLPIFVYWLMEPKLKAESSSEGIPTGEGRTVQVEPGAVRDEIASLVSLTREIVLQTKIGASSAII